jgi:hypothetical protein
LSSVKYWAIPAWPVMYITCLSCLPSWLSSLHEEIIHVWAFMDWSKVGPY